MKLPEIPEPSPAPGRFPKLLPMLYVGIQGVVACDFIGCVMG
jgi:hypothetical protein